VHQHPVQQVQKRQPRWQLKHLTEEKAMEHLTENQIDELEAMGNSVFERFLKGNESFEASADDVMEAAEWFSALPDNHADELIEWYNSANSNYLDLLVLHQAAITKQIRIDQCRGCGKAWVNTTAIEHWGDFQGVSYEGEQVFTWVEGHIEGNTPLKREACTDCQG
jgi:hypothetical protein